MKQAGLRDRLITIYRQDSTLDAYGSRSSNAWTKVVQLWAQLLPRGGRSVNEGVAAHQLFPQSKTIFIIDHPDPTGVGAEEVPRHDDRIQWDGREFYIEGMEEIGRRDGLRLYCIEKGDGIAS